MKKLVMTESFQALPEQIPLILQYLSDAMEQAGTLVQEKSAVLTIAEGSLRELLMRCGSSDELITLTVRHPPLKTGRMSFSLRCAGSAVSLTDIQQRLIPEGFEEETDEILQSRLLPVIEQDLTISAKRGVNEIRLRVRTPANKIQINLAFLLAGLLFGFLVKTILPASASAFVSTQLCGLVVTIFFNLLKLLIVPIVFCSIALSVGEFSDLRQLGKLGLSTLLYFFAYSVLGIAAGWLVFQIIPCGSAELLRMVNLSESAAEAASTSSTVWQSLRSFLLSIFPANLIQAWLDNDILAVIFLAVLFGAAARKLSPAESAKVKDILQLLNHLISRLTGMVVSLMPLVIFCSMTKVSVSLNLREAADLLLYVLDMLIGFAIMFLLFTLTLLLNRQSPAKFYRNFSPTLFTAFSLASSSAVIPTSLDCCNKAGISGKISNFVIPLGATINMNGCCVTLMVTCLFLARCFGVAVPTQTLLLLAVMILLFSMAAPGVPGSLIVMLAGLLSLMDIPAEATNIIIAVSSIVGMFMVPVNSMGDAMVSVLLDAAEKKSGGRS